MDAGIVQRNLWLVCGELAHTLPVIPIVCVHEGVNVVGGHCNRSFNA